MKLKAVPSLVKASFIHWYTHRSQRMGAALSFYTIFSIVPLLTIGIIVIGHILNQAYLQSAIIDQVRNLVGSEGAEFIQSILSSVTGLQFNLATIIVSAGTFLIGTLGVFYELKNSLDDMWDVDPSSKNMRGWKYFFSAHILSLSMIPILGFVFLVSLLFSAILSFVAGYSPALANLTFLIQAITIATSFLVMTGLFAFIYRYLPNRKLPWKELLRGAFVTALLFMLGKFVINFYISELAGTSAFGAAGAFVVLLLWVYYSAQIFLFGAALTYMYSKKYGRLKR